MRIALYHHLPSGGALSHFSDVARALAAAGHRLSLFAPESAELCFAGFSDILEERVIFPRQPWRPGGPGLAPLNPLRYRLYLEALRHQERVQAQAIAAGGFDGLYLGQCRTWTEPPLLAHLPPDLPAVLFCAEPKRAFHDAWGRAAMERWPWWKKLWREPTVRWMRAVQQRNILCARKVLCNSRYSKARIEEAYPGCKPEVNYIGVDTEFFCPADVPREDLLVSVGAFEPSKNHRHALEVAALRPAGRRFKVVLIGDRESGGGVEELRQRARALDVALDLRVRVPRAELRDVLRRARAMVYCPFQEPFGIAAIESQACGTPVLGRAEGGLLETIEDGRTGRLLLDDPCPYAEQLVVWNADPGSYQQFSRQAREHILAHFDRRALTAHTVASITAALATR